MIRRKLRNVRIVPGCISCGTCEAICPKVFKVEGLAEVIGTQKDFLENEELVREAVDMCPVSVIKIDEEDEGDGNIK